MAWYQFLVGVATATDTILDSPQDTLPSSSSDIRYPTPVVGPNGLYPSPYAPPEGCRDDEEWRGTRCRRTDGGRSTRVYRISCFPKLTPAIIEAGATLSLVTRYVQASCPGSTYCYPHGGVTKLGRPKGGLDDSVKSRIDCLTPTDRKRRRAGRKPKPTAKSPTSVGIKRMQGLSKQSRLTRIAAYASLVSDRTTTRLPERPIAVRPIVVGIPILQGFPGEFLAPAASSGVSGTQPVQYRPESNAMPQWRPVVARIQMPPPVECGSEQECLVPSPSLPPPRPLPPSSPDISKAAEPEIPEAAEPVLTEARPANAAAIIIPPDIATSSSRADDLTWLDELLLKDDHESQSRHSLAVPNAEAVLAEVNPATGSITATDSTNAATSSQAAGLSWLDELLLRYDLEDRPQQSVDVWQDLSWPSP